MLRKDYLERLWSLKELQLIKVVTGIRRCGKSTLLMQFADMLRESGVADEQIVRLNFEELENENLLNYNDLYDYLKSKMCKGRYTYFFLDEIQKVPSYEKVVDSLYVKKDVDIYITGSNAYILSSELGTLLSGRYIEINMLPLSFSEYKEMMTGDENKLLAEYVSYGGMPYAALIRKNGLGSEDAYIEGIYNTVFVKDIEDRQRRKEPDPSRRNINDIPLLKNIAKYLSGVIGSPVSMKKIADYLTSNGRKTSHVTVDSYVTALTESYLFYRADRMDVNGKAVLKQNQKYYMSDLGFRRHILAKQNYDIGFSLENIVYLELIRRGYAVYIGKSGITEVDFVAFKGGEYSYFQVSATILEQSTHEREIAPLKNIQDNYPKTIITGDTLGLGNYGGIHIVNIIDWLLKRV